MQKKKFMAASPLALFCDRRLCDVQPYSIQKGVFTMHIATTNKLKNENIITTTIAA